MLTTEERRKLNEALTKCHGDRKLACAVLNITPSQLKNLINDNADLKKSWGRKSIGEGDVTDVEVVSVVSEMDTLATKTEEEKEAEFCELLEKTGSLPEDVKAAMSLQRMYGQYAGRCLDLVGGGLVNRAMKLLKLCDQLETQMNDGNNALSMEQLDVWNETYSSAHTAIIKIMEVLTGSQLAKVKAELFKSQANGANKNKQKPSFGPKTTNNIVAQSVTVER